VQADLEQALGNSWHLVLTQSDATRTLMASMQGATLALSAAPSPAPPAPAPAPSPSPSPLASPSPSLVAKAG
ncbi:MAG: hypothetical protein ACXVBW_15315, partial [Bdellovibrionota bacterium]